MKNTEYISDFEDLIKIKTFHANPEMKMAYDCTYEKIAKALKDEYAQNINDKINRWVGITNVQYFEDVKCIIYYFQAKMLYRDGFYESAIMLARSISEMTCYDLLSKTQHPFGNIELIETPMFRVFVDFLALPKKIEKTIFESQIINLITDTNNKNLIKSSYELDTTKKMYRFKIENGKEKSNLKRFFEAFASVGFTNIDSFRNDTKTHLHNIYDIGNLYVHSKSSIKTPKEDAVESLNMLTHILSDIYNLKSGLEGKTIKSGYTDFPDICLGMNYALEASLTLEDAGRIYYNIPPKKYFDKLMQTVGIWNGEWQNEKGDTAKGVLTFSLETQEHIIANIKYSRNNEEITEQMEIKLFDNYIHLIGFDEKDMLHKKGKHIFFELEFFNESILMGESLDFKGKVIFERKAKN
jgi:hypothetical protein